MSCPNPLTLKEVMFIGVFVWAVDVVTVGGWFYINEKNIKDKRREDRLYYSGFCGGHVA